jgi:leucyl/phenylalanyl-tRNA--protein transferase
MKLFATHRRRFPDPRFCSEEGIVAFGDDFSIDTLLEAYSFGIFPWPHEGLPCPWFSPDPRGVLDCDRLRINASLRKFLKKTDWRVTFNEDFGAVIRACAASPRSGHAGTWITAPMIHAYTRLHAAGYAYSVECWEGNEMVGGLYGVNVAGVVSGESMFFKKSNASKLCLLRLIDLLRDRGATFMDIQMITPVTESLGGRYISREEFLNRLEQSKREARRIVLPQSGDQEL